MSGLDFGPQMASDDMVSMLMHPEVADVVQKMLCAPGGLELADAGTEPGVRHVIVRPTAAAMAVADRLGLVDTFGARPGDPR